MSQQPGPDGQYPNQPYVPQGPGAYQSPAGGYPPQPSGYPAQPGGYPPQPPAAPVKKKSWFARHKILTVLGAIVLVVILANVLGGGGSEDPEAGGGSADQAEEGAAGEGAPADEEAPAETSEPEPEPDAPGLGDAARDGQFEFVVSEIETGVEGIGNEFLSTEPQGQFVLVHMSVTNIGDDPQFLFDSEQSLFDTEGREHSADTEAGIYLEDNETFISEINPGNTLEGALVFDIPADATPAALELHDSAFSGGVTVTVQ
ncbi:DUF4352 domain-containing protein [Ruania suaedae]|uniref:DUF4352 domain-containing protein n=1 Tax=Ruania suaedae TaxID=2897774 RepID=UPI001E3F52A1|nr:DUF4352 domain-containing protein [Ruania suaedae]UFU03769.1 DUF4352 domain-containing protein [Ruania suaedae]